MLKGWTLSGSASDIDPHLLNLNTRWQRALLSNPEECSLRLRKAKGPLNTVRDPFTVNKVLQKLHRYPCTYHGNDKLLYACIGELGKYPE